MQQSNLAILGYLATFRLLLSFSNWLIHKINIHPESTRKLLHFLMTVLALPYLVIFKSIWEVLMLQSAIFISLYLSVILHSFKSIGSVDRKSWGAPLLPVGIFGSYFIGGFSLNSIVYILPLLILAISDPLAALIGQRYHSWAWFTIIPGFRSNKTYIGSGVFFVSSFIISIVTLSFYQSSMDFSMILTAAIIAALGSLLELICSKGWDNFMIPIGLSLTLFVLNASN